MGSDFNICFILSPYIWFILNKRKLYILCWSFTNCVKLCWVLVRSLSFESKTMESKTFDIFGWLYRFIWILIVKFRKIILGLYVFLWSHWGSWMWNQLYGSTCMCMGLFPLIKRIGCRNYCWCIWFWIIYIFKTSQRNS